MLVYLKFMSKWKDILSQAHHRNLNQDTLEVIQIFLDKWLRPDPRWTHPHHLAKAYWAVDCWCYNSTSVPCTYPFHYPVS